MTEYVLKTVKYHWTQYYAGSDRDGTIRIVNDANEAFKFEAWAAAEQAVVCLPNHFQVVKLRHPQVVDDFQVDDFQREIA